MALNFAMTGVAGFVAPRHLKAIADTGNSLVAAVDPHDSVGVLDQYFPNAAFFTEGERFDRYLEKRRRGPADERVHYLSVCSPNHLHDAHVRLALRVGAHAISEKPLVISPWNLDQLSALEAEYDRRVFTVLQLRMLPELQALAEERRSPSAARARVTLTYVTVRGPWYHASWKGAPEKSGGLPLNIGVHLFDLLIWLFGSVESSSVILREPDKTAGVLRLRHADVQWFLSLDGGDLPDDVRAAKKRAYRCLSVDGRELELSSQFPALHTTAYSEVLAGRGFGIDVVRPSIELAHSIRMAPLCAALSSDHPLVRP